MPLKSGITALDIFALTRVIWGTFQGRAPDFALEWFMFLVYPALPRTLCHVCKFFDNAFDFDGNDCVMGLIVTGRCARRDLRHLFRQIPVDPG